MEATLKQNSELRQRLGVAGIDSDAGLKLQKKRKAAEPEPPKPSEPQKVLLQLIRSTACRKLEEICQPNCA